MAYETGGEAHDGVKVALCARVQGRVERKAFSPRMSGPISESK